MCKIRILETGSLLKIILLLLSFIFHHFKEKKIEKYKKCRYAVRYRTKYITESGSEIKEEIQIEEEIQKIR